MQDRLFAEILAQRIGVLGIDLRFLSGGKLLGYTVTRGGSCINELAHSSGTRPLQGMNSRHNVRRKVLSRLFDGRDNVTDARKVKDKVHPRKNRIPGLYPAQ